MGDDYDYKDIYDFDLKQFGNRDDDYYEKDDSIIEKKFTEKELEDFKNKVKKYCKNLIENGILHVNYHLNEDKLAKEIFMQLEDISGEEYFSETIIEDFYGQQNLFFEYAEEIATEIACEYKEKRKKEEKNEFLNKIDKIIKDCSTYEAVVKITGLLNQNDSYKNIDEADVVRKFIEHSHYGACVPSEILEYLDPKLIQEDDALMEDLLGCWIDSVDDLYTYYDDEDYWEKHVYESYWSEHYEEFYDKVISENINGVGTKNYDYDEYHNEDDERYGDFKSGKEAYCKAFEKNPHQMLRILGGKYNLTHEDIAYFPINFIIREYGEAGCLDDIEFLLKDKEYADLRVNTIFEFLEDYSYIKTLEYDDFDDFDEYSEEYEDFEEFGEEYREYDLDDEVVNKLEHIVIENIEECNESCKKRFEIIDSYTKRFIIECYVRCKKELPEDIKEIMNIEEKEIEKIKEEYKLKKLQEAEDIKEFERIKKEYELKKLQEEDKKCDEALELVEKLDKNKKQEEYND